MLSSGVNKCENSVPCSSDPVNFLGVTVEQSFGSNAAEFVLPFGKRQASRMTAQLFPLLIV